MKSHVFVLKLNFESIIIFQDQDRCIWEYF